MTSIDTIKNQAKTIADAVKSELKKIDSDRPVTINMTFNITPETVTQQTKTDTSSTTPNKTTQSSNSAMSNQKPKVERRTTAEINPNRRRYHYVRRSNPQSFDSIKTIKDRIYRDAERKNHECKCKCNANTNNHTTDTKKSDTNGSKKTPMEYESSIPGVKKYMVYEDNDPSKNTYHKKYTFDDGSTTEIYYSSSSDSSDIDGRSFGNFFW